MNTAHGLLKTISGLYVQTHLDLIASCCEKFLLQGFPQRAVNCVNQAAGTKDLRLELPDLLLKGKNCSSYVIVTQQNTE